MSERFFVECPISGDSAELIGQEAIHLTKVLRARVGDEIVLFDGSGVEFLAKISHLDRHRAGCEILEVRRTDREAARRTTVGVALPKGDRQRFLVEKLTELGTTHLTPLITRRAIVQPDTGTVERLQRFVVEASKQCGRNRLMQVTEPQVLSTFLGSSPSQAFRWIAHPVAELPLGQRTVTDLSREPSRDVVIAIGPEGGFTDEEVAAAISTGWTPVSLGTRVLRIETAAIAFAAIATLF